VNKHVLHQRTCFVTEDKLQEYFLFHRMKYLTKINLFHMDMWDLYFKLRGCCPDYNFGVNGLVVSYCDAQPSG
jgi:hypothetical protein